MSLRSTGTSLFFLQHNTSISLKDELWKLVSTESYASIVPETKSHPSQWGTFLHRYIAVKDQMELEYTPLNRIAKRMDRSVPKEQMATDDMQAGFIARNACREILPKSVCREAMKDMVINPSQKIVARHIARKVRFLSPVKARCVCRKN